MRGKYRGTEDQNFDKHYEKGTKFSITAPTSYRHVQRGEDGTYASGKFFIAGDERGGRTVGGEKDLPTDGKTYVPRASSAIAEVKYDPDQNLASIRYVGGEKYYDFDVDPADFQEFVEAPSKGRWVEKVWKKYNRL